VGQYIFVLDCKMRTVRCCQSDADFCVDQWEIRLSYRRLVNPIAFIIIWSIGR